MDWAHVLIWIVCLATGVNAAILLWTRAGLRHARSWLLLQLLIFGGTAGGAYFSPKAAALGGGIAWFFLVLAPSLLLRLLYRLSSKRQYAQAILVARVLRLLWVHSSEGLEAQQELLSILQQISLGEEAIALERLEQIAAVEGPLQQTARYFSFYLRGDWEGLEVWLKRELSDAGVTLRTLTDASSSDDAAGGRGDAGPLDDGKLSHEPTTSAAQSDHELVDSDSKDADNSNDVDQSSEEATETALPNAPQPGVVQLFWLIRAKAELGQLEEAVALHQAYESLLGQQGELSSELRALLMAFSGRVSVVRELLNGPLQRWAPQSRSLLMATAELAAGQEESGRKRLEQLLAEGDSIIRLRATARLEKASEPAIHAQGLPSAQRRYLDELTDTMSRELRYAGQQSLHRRPWLTWSITAALLAVFGMMEWRGGSTNSRVLLEMGAMVPALVLKGEWWRVFAFQMLHFGALHLLLNLLALLFFGPFIERTIGAVRYLVLYFFAGVGGGALITGAIYMKWMPELRYAAYVGASGAIFGLIGAMLAIMLKGWLREKVVLARRRIIWLLLIIGFQTIFDINTPKVSLGAHWSGLIIGFLVTMLLWSPKRSQNADPAS